MVVAYIRKGVSRWFVYLPGKFGYSAVSRDGATHEARLMCGDDLRLVPGTAPGVSNAP
jgi:hypothetical protein